MVQWSLKTGLRVLEKSGHFIMTLGKKYGYMTYKVFSYMREGLGPSDQELLNWVYLSAYNYEV